MSMIDLSELLPIGVSLDQLPLDHQTNLLAFLPKLQAFRAKSGLIMVCDSGYRTKAHHEEVYAVKNELRKKQGLKPVNIPWGSAHLFGWAADFRDRDRRLAAFAEDEKEFVRYLGFHFEVKSATSFPTPWLHIQGVSPKSDNLWFQP
jgi:hypothetical protein